jgi:hypothetical protein
MFGEDAQFEMAMYNISPELTCKCHHDYTCQQCLEDERNQGYADDVSYPE